MSSCNMQAVGRKLSVTRHPRRHVLDALLRRLLSTLITKIRHGVLLLTPVIPIHFPPFLNGEHTECLGPRHPPFFIDVGRTFLLKLTCPCRQ
eukprot:scaffold182366_cov20-Tisochrysis_lutea.AAC.1